MTNAAPVGKRCDRCLCCPAVIVSESERSARLATTELIHPCLKVSRRRRNRSLYLKPTCRSGPVPVPKPERKDAMSIRSGRGPGKRIDLETRRAVLAADPEISHSQLARELGISDPSVKNIRMRAHAAAAPTAEEPAWVPERREKRRARQPYTSQ